MISFFGHSTSVPSASFTSRPIVSPRTPGWWSRARGSAPTSSWRRQRARSRLSPRSCAGSCWWCRRADHGVTPACSCGQSGSRERSRPPVVMFSRWRAWRRSRRRNRHPTSHPTSPRPSRATPRHPTLPHVTLRHPTSHIGVCFAPGTHTLDFILSETREFGR